MPVSSIAQLVERRSRNPKMRVQIPLEAKNFSLSFACQINMNQHNNALARTKAASLRKKMAKFEFVFAKMFMRLIMRNTKIMTVQIQNPELNILDGLVLIDHTVTSLKEFEARNQN